jgi:hypothetical protein
MLLLVFLPKADDWIDDGDINLSSLLLLIN